MIGTVVAIEMDTMEEVRIVMSHTTGVWAGLRQIVGVWPKSVVVPGILEDVNGQARLVKTTPRAIYFQTVAPQPEGQGAKEEPVA